MSKTKGNSRTQLIQAAEKTTYLYGFGSTSIANIAKAAGVPLGNVYFYFKTKDEIGSAIVELRVSRFKKLLEDLDKSGSPKERLCGFVNIKIKNREAVARGGCPIGTLCSELQKYGGAAAKKSRVLFAEALSWMQKQFEALGKGADSRGYAVHLLSATQGASVLAHTFHDATMVATEAERLKEWIRAL
jgi:TetR/AcrR family transcriptional regulator, transcriptional repressor for nem operon